MVGSLLSVTSWYQSHSDLMGNPINQQRLEHIEADLEWMKDLFPERVALEERMPKKQDNTDKTLAQLLEGQTKLLEKDTQSIHDHSREKEENWRRGDNEEREEMYESHHVHNQERGNGGSNRKNMRLD